MEKVKTTKQKITIPPRHLYEWIRVPFGLTNASAEFQRFMETCLFDIRDEFAFPYLDDVIVYSKDFRSRLDHLRIVFRRLKDGGIKINPAKCKFFQKEVNFLVRVITGDRYKTDSKNVSAVKCLATKPPKTIHDLQHLLWLLDYYRRYVKNFSKVAYLLFKLLKKNQINNKSTKPLTSITWKEEHQQSLQRIVDILTNPPTLSYPDFSSLFKLHVDASSKWLGYDLYQIIDGGIKILGNRNTRCRQRLSKDEGNT